MLLYLASGIFVTCSTRISDITTRLATHLALGKDAPVSRAVQAVGSIVAKPLLGGLHHQYVRI
jgi:hypothetical protein